VIKREYLSRVRKKSFLIMSILGPLLLVGGIALMAYLIQEPSLKQEILVVDEKAPAFRNLKATDNITFTYSAENIESAREIFKNAHYTALLYIPKNIEHSNVAQLYCKKQPPQAIIRYVEDQVEDVVEALKLDLYKMDKKAFYDVKTNFALIPLKLSDAGLEEEIDLGKTAIGFVFGLLIYLFIFLYGIQVMRGVIEEKTSRIIEVIITSVKPFQLMMGKIIGIGLVSLTQFAIWIMLSMGLFSLAGSHVAGLSTPGRMPVEAQTTEEIQKQIAQEWGGQSKEINAINNLMHRTNWGLMFGLFIFYFIGGYLLYAALFASIGSMVDSETDTQQFMWPVTLPLILAYVASATIIENPEGQVAFWFSIIPLTSPVVMLVRVGVGIGDTGIPVWEVALSAALLILGFLFAVWLASRIYRTGILMYGKRPTYREVLKWITYKP
jgi:ABC-2 type transport system permease protein